MVWCLQHWLWIHQEEKKKEKAPESIEQAELTPPPSHLASRPTFIPLLTQPNFPVLSTTPLWFLPALSIASNTETVPLAQKKQSRYLVGHLGNLSPWTEWFYLSSVWSDKSQQNPWRMPCTELPPGGIPARRRRRRRRLLLLPWTLSATDWPTGHSRRRLPLSSSSVVSLGPWWRRAACRAPCLGL